MGTLTDKIREAGRASAAPSNNASGFGQVDPREQAIIDKERQKVNGSLRRRIAEAKAMGEIESRRQQRTEAEKAPPEIAAPVKEMLSSLNDRNKVLDIYRKLTPEQRQQAIALAPGIAQQLGDNRGGFASRAAKAAVRGVAGVSQPVTELVGAGGSAEEIEYIRQLQAASQEFAPARPDDPWYEQGSLGAMEMAPWMATVVGGAGLGRAAATGVAGKVATSAAAGNKVAQAAQSAGQAVGRLPQAAAARAGISGVPALSAGTAGQLGGITAAAFPSQYAQEVDQLKALGMQDGTQLRMLAGGTAVVTGLIEGIVPNPLKAGPVPLTEGAVKAARQYLWEAAKRAPAEMSEEYLQGVTSGLGETVGGWLDENAKDKTVADAFRKGWAQSKEAALPMAFLLGVPAIGGAGMSAMRAQRLARLQEMRAKGFISEEDAKQEGIEGKNRRERLANADREIEELQKQPPDAAADPGSPDPAAPPAQPQPPTQPPQLPGPAAGQPPAMPPQLPGPTQPPQPSQGPPQLPGPTQSPPQLPSPPSTTPPKPNAPAATETLIGTNSKGEQVFEDAFGVRSVVSGSARITEPVEMQPFRTPEGKIGYRPVLSGERSPEFEVAPPTETKQEPKPQEAPAEEPKQPQLPAPQSQKPASGSSAAESADTAEWDIVPGSDGKLYRENPSPDLKPSERIKTRQPIDPSEGVVLVTKDQFGKPIPSETLKARQEFADNAKAGAEFEHKGYQGQSFKVLDDGTLLNSSGRKMGNVQSMANTIAPGQVTFKTTAESQPTPAVADEPKGTVAVDDPEFKLDAMPRVSRPGIKEEPTHVKSLIPKSESEPDMELALQEDRGEESEADYINGMVTTETVPIERLESGQSIVEAEGVRHFIKNPKVEGLKLPLIIQFGDKMIVRDGNTRVNAAILRGEKTIRARVLFVSEPIAKPGAERPTTPEPPTSPEDAELESNRAKARELWDKHGKRFLEDTYKREGLKDTVADKKRKEELRDNVEGNVIANPKGLIRVLSEYEPKSPEPATPPTTEKMDAAPESKWSSETRAKLEAVPALKGAKVETDEKNGRVRVTRPDGLQTVIYFNADKTIEDAAKARGRKPEAVHGWYFRKPGDKYGRIYIHSKANHTNILNHEVMHWLEDNGVVTKEEVEAMGGREAIAEKYGKWASLRFKKKDSVFQRIYDALEPVFSSQARFFAEVGSRKAEPKVSPIGDKKPTEQQDKKASGWKPFKSDVSITESPDLKRETSRRQKANPEFPLDVGSPVTVYRRNSKGQEEMQEGVVEDFADAMPANIKVRLNDGTLATPLVADVGPPQTKPSEKKSSAPVSRTVARTRERAAAAEAEGITPYVTVIRTLSGGRRQYEGYNPTTGEKIATGNAIAGPGSVPYKLSNRKGRYQPVDTALYPIGESDTFTTQWYESEAARYDKETDERIAKDKQQDAAETTPASADNVDSGEESDPEFEELETLPQGIPAYVISGMQRSPGRIDEQKLTGRPIGVAVGPQRMSGNVVRKIAAHVDRGGILFVDSGMFGTVSKGEIGEEPNWGNVFAEYARILELIKPRNRRNVMFVAPDYLVKVSPEDPRNPTGKDLVIGDTMRTLDLQERYGRQIEELMDSGARVIIPIQRDMSADPMSLGEIVGIASDPIDLMSGNFAWGIPYNEAAWPDDQILDFVRANKGSGMHLHLLGGGKPRAEKLWEQIKDIDPTVKLTGDAASEARNAYRVEKAAAEQPVTESGGLSVDEFANIFANPELAPESPTEKKPKKPRPERKDAPPRKPKAPGEKKTTSEGIQEGLDEAKAGADLILKGLKDIAKGSNPFSGPPINRDIAVGMGMMANGLIKAGKYKFVEFIDAAVEMLGVPAVRYLGPYLEAGWNKKAEADDRLDKATSVANYLSEESDVDTTRDDDTEAMGDDTPKPDSKSGKGGKTKRPPRGDKPAGTPGRGDDAGAGDGSNEDSGGNRDGVSAPSGSLNNHQIAERPDWLEGGPVTKLNRNIDAIVTMNRVEAEGRRATPSEQAIIAKYTGWGHLKQFFIRDSDLRAIKAIQGDKWNLNALQSLDARMEEQIRDQGRRKGHSDEQIEAKVQRELANNKHRLRLATSMTPAEYAQARKSTRYSHYTDPSIARAMWSFIQDALPDAGKIRVLEPSEGSGMFWGTMPDAMFKRAEMHGVDMDPSSSRIARHLYPSVRHLNTPFQDSPYPEAFFDLAITNVPFNKNPVQDPNAAFDGELSLHNYFFAKAASRVREGGVVVFITTHFTMDAGVAKQRSVITEQGLKFLGAVRLNQDAFGNVANTKVTTDIIVMQKVAPGSLKSNNTFELPAVSVTAPHGEQSAEITVHPYFTAKPSMVAGKITANGEMRGADPELTVESEMTPEETAEFISRALKAIEVDKDAFTRGQQNRKDMEEATQGSTTFVPEHLKDLGIGKLAVDGTNLVVRTSEETMLVVKTEFSPTLKARAEKWFAIRDALTSLQQLQTRPDNPVAEIEAARKELNRVYDEFVGEFNEKKNDYSGYKPLNTTYNKAMFAADYMSAGVLALENTKLIPTGELDKDGKEKTRLRVEKASIFTERTEWPLEHRPKPGTIREALAHSMFTNGGIDIDWIANTLGQSKLAVTKQLEEYAFEVPNNGGWEIKEVYLSGNIAKKLELAEEAAAKNPAFTRNVDALRQVLPVPKTFEQLVVYPNSPFLPVDLLREFISEALGLGAFELYRNEQDLGGGWRANYDKNANVNQTNQDLEQYAVREGRRTRRRGFDLFLDMMAGKPTVILDTDADGRSFVNEAMTNLAKRKRADLARAFDTFVRSKQERMDAVTNEFNRLLSGYVKPSIPDWVVSFDGMSSNWKDLMRAYQKEAAAKVAMGGNTLLAHRVGYGKTLSGVAGIMEQRRLGVARKPVVVVPNHLTGQWAKAFADFYPSAKVMAPTSKDFEKQNRQATMNRIMTGNWDAIIIPESSFKKLPMSSEYVEQFFQDQISQSIDAAERARAQEGADPRTIAELEDITERLRNQLQKYLAEAQKDPGPFFDEMGIDSLTVDEAHHYKNLPFYTQNTRVAGINPTGSQQAFDMLMKTDFINTITGSRNVTFLTGTPIANSMTEAWVMMRYLMPEALKEANVFAFDDWKNTFGEVVDLTRVNTIGTGFRTETRFQQFVNLDVLASMFQQVADIQMINNDVQVPPLKGGKPQSIVVPASDAMKNFMLGLAARSAAMPKDPSEDNMLNVMTIGAGAAIDFRLLDAAAMPSETSKITVAADKVAEIYKQTEPFKGTQIIWADRGVPKTAKKLTAEMKQLGAWMLEEVQSRPLTMEEIKAKWKELRPTKNASAELQRFIGMALQDMNYTTGSEEDEASYKVEIQDEPAVWVNEITDVDPNITEQAAPPWNVYQQMKQELVARGIPAEKIVFIHDYKTAAQKVQLWEKMNNGDLRILIGNTPRLGTGANIQQRLVAAHHLDAPWRPADVEQRDGRIIRSGNRVMTIGSKIGYAEQTGVELDGVIINRYVTEGSIDARYWDTNEMKAQMLQDFWSGNPGVSIEELGATTLSMSDVKAAAVANPLLKRKIELEHEVGKLSEDYRGAVQSKTQSESRLADAKKEVPEAKAKLKKAKERVAWWEEGKASLPEGETFAVEIDGEVLFRRDDIAKAIDRKLHAVGREVPLAVVQNDASDWAKQSQSKSSEAIELGTVFGKKIIAMVDGGFRNQETGEVFGGNTWQERQLAKGLKDGSWERSYSSALIRVEGIDGLTKLGVTPQGFAARIRNFVDPGQTWVEDHEKALASKEKTLEEMEKLVKSIPDPDSTKLVAAQQELEEISNAIGEEDDDQIKHWVATEQLERTLGPVTLREQLGRVDSSEVLLGYIDHPQHGRLSVFNRAGDTRPPAHAMVWVEGENATIGYAPRDEEGVMGRFIAKRRMRLGKIQHPEHGELFVFNHKEGDAVQKGKVWVESEDGSQTFGYQDKDLNVVMGVEMQKNQLSDDWPTDVKRQTDQSKLSNRKKRDDNDDGADDGTITPSTRQSQRSNVRQSRTSRRRPLTQEEAIAAADIQRTVQDMFDVAVRQKGFSEKAEGIYKWMTRSAKSPKSPEVIRTREHQYASLAVLSHEVAHHIDETMKVVKKMPATVAAEVKTLDYEPAKARAFEGWAEFFRRYVTEPPIDVNGTMMPNTFIDAPLTTEWFEKTFLPANPEMANKIKQFQQYAQQFANQSVFARLGTMIADRKPQDLRYRERWKQKSKRWLNRLKTYFVDKFHTLEWIQEEAKAKGYKGEGIYNLTMAYFLSSTAHATVAFEEGVGSLTEGRKIGKTKLWDISRHLQNDGEYDEAVRYALARHTLFMDEVKPGFNTGVDVDDAQAWVEEAKALGKADRYDEFAKELAQFNDDLILMLVDAGALSGDDASKMLNYYRDNAGQAYYFPLHRVSDLDSSDFAGTSAGFVNLGKPVKGRSKSGSGRQIIDPVDATVTRAIKFYGRAIQARQAQTLAKTLDPKLGGVGGMGGLMDRVPAKRVVHQGTIEEILGTLVDAGVVEADQAKAMRIAAKILNPANGMPSEASLDWFANKYQIVDWQNNWSDMEDAARQEPDAMAVISLWRPDYTPSAQKRTVMIYDEDGNKLMYEMDDDLYRVSTGMQEIEFDAFTKLLSESQRYFKTGAVGLSTGFGTANLLRDYFEFQGKANYVKGAKSLVKPWEMLGRYIAAKTRRSMIGKYISAKTGVTSSDDPMIRLYEELGGKLYSIIGHEAAGRTLVRRKKLSKSTMSRLGLSVTRPMDTAANILSNLQEMIAITDAPPRMADAEAALAEHGFVSRNGQWVDVKTGQPTLLPESARIAASVAMAEATINFKRIGAYGHHIEAYLPFSNAIIQATYRSYKQVKNLKSLGKKAIEGDRAKRTLIYLSALAATAVFYWLQRHDDDDYRNQEAWLRDGYWTWGWNGKTYVRIPKPRDFGVVTNVVENLLDAWAHEDARNTSEILTRDAASRIPTGGGLMRGAVETYIANYDYFRGRELEDKSVEDLPKEYRTSPYTSRMSDYLGKHLGEALNTSPIQFQHLLSSASGGMYSRMTETYDAAQDGRVGPEHVPFLRGLILNRHQARPISEFYQSKTELEKIAARQKVENESEGVDPALAGKIAYFDWISEMMTKLRREEAKVGKKRTFEHEKYITGLARSALGYQEQESNPNPLTAKDLPANVRAAVDHYRQLAVFGAAERLSPRSAFKSDESYKQQAEQISRAEAKLKALNLSVGEAKQLLRDYWIKTSGSLYRKNSMNAALESRMRKLEDLLGDKPK